MNRWDEVYKSASDDSCLLETLYSEFKTDSDSKKSMTEDIAKAIEGYAKEKGEFDKISGLLNILKGSSGNSEKYSAFNRIIRELNNMAGT